MLLVLGILLILTGVPVYVILPAYAILFLLAVPFTGMPARSVLWTAVALAVIMPLLQPVLNTLPIWRMPFSAELDVLIGWHYPFTVWIAFVLAGLGIARAGIARLSVYLRMLVAGGALAAIGYGLAELPDTRGRAVLGIGVVGGSAYVRAARSDRLRRNRDRRDRRVPTALPHRGAQSDHPAAESSRCHAADGIHGAARDLGARRRHRTRRHDGPRRVPCIARVLAADDRRRRSDARPGRS